MLAHKLSRFQHHLNFSSRIAETCTVNENLLLRSPSTDAEEIIPSHAAPSWLTLGRDWGGGAPKTHVVVVDRSQNGAQTLQLRPDKELEFGVSRHSTPALPKSTCHSLLSEKVKRVFFFFPSLGEINVSWRTQGVSGIGQREEVRRRVGGWGCKATVKRGLLRMAQKALSKQITELWILSRRRFIIIRDHFFQVHRHPSFLARGCEQWSVWCLKSSPPGCKETVTKMAGLHQRASLIQKQAGPGAFAYTGPESATGDWMREDPPKPQKLPKQFPPKLVELNLAQNELGCNS